MLIAKKQLIAAAALGALVCAACSSNDQPASTGQVHGGTGAGGAGGSGGGGGADVGPLALQPGDVAELAVSDGVTGAELATPSGDEKFVLVLASMKLDTSAKEHAYSISSAGPPPAAATATTVDGCSLSSATWSTQKLPAETPPSGTAASVGDTRQFFVETPTGTKTVQAQAIAVGAAAVVWADISPTNPAILDPTAVTDFLSSFEQTILPRARTVFGVESDLDADGHIGLVFTPVTYESAVAFFTGCDLQSVPGCGTGNHGEFLYLTPPNAIDPPYNTPTAIKEILAHELSHMIHFNRKVLLNGLDGWDESAYMIEGVGGFAQDVLGYQAGNLYVTMAGLDGIDQFSLGETFVDTAQYDTKRDGVLRGGSYLFVRWFYDRAGGDQAPADGTIASTGGPALLRTLLDSKSSIADALPGTAGAPIEDIAMDFYTAIAASNRDEIGQAAPRNPCFAYLPTVADPVTTKQRGADLFAKFHQQQMQGPKLQPADQVDGQILDGGAEWIELDASAGASALSFSVTADPVVKPRARIVRIH